MANSLDVVNGVAANDHYVMNQQGLTTATAGGTIVKPNGVAPTSVTLARNGYWAVIRLIAQALGLQPEWAVRVIAAGGNYGEIFNRTVGKRFGLERGLNALWTAGGLMHPVPMK